MGAVVVLLIYFEFRQTFSVLVRDRQRNDTLDQTDPYIKYNLLPSRLVSKKGPLVLLHLIVDVFFP